MSQAPGPAEPRVPQTVTDQTAVRNNRLDIHRIGETHLGIFREPFDRVATLGGFRLRPANAELTVWSFQDAATGMPGRLLDVPGWLQEDHVLLDEEALIYMVRDRGRLLALLLPRAPRRIKLTEANFKVVPAKESGRLYPNGWPRGLVNRVIRNWLQNVVIVDEKYLLARLTR